MPYIELTLRSATQSWGKPELWGDERRTEEAPTERVIYGLLGRALGYQRDDERFPKLKEDVKVEIVKPQKPKYILIDDQVINCEWYCNRLGLSGLPSGEGGTRTGSTKYAATLSKEYLEDCISDCPHVKLYSDTDTLKAIIHALRRPRYPYYFGRYCCIPAGNITDGIIKEDEACT